MRDWSYLSALRQCVAVWCSMLCCSVLQCVAVCGSESMFRRVYLHVNLSLSMQVSYTCALLYVAVCCSVLQCVAVRCSVSQCVVCDAVCCSALRCDVGLLAACRRHPIYFYESMFHRVCVHVDVSVPIYARVSHVSLAVSYSALQCVQVHCSVSESVVLAPSFPHYRFKLKQDLILNLYCKILRSLSFSIWWISGMLYFQWKLSYGCSWIPTRCTAALPPVPTPLKRVTALLIFNQLDRKTVDFLVSAFQQISCEI